ncbi:hypothetical protein ABZ611_31870 [Streptomyces sp. NPDC007861]|uniref:hypothetical protein n=1 Tax=Streptomyces sp. NPDC007861 TaxID=3154893 RepID=UPI0033F9B117
MKRSEYEALAVPFRERLLEGDWPDDPDQWLKVEAVVRCTTPTCAAFDVADPVTLHENADGVYRVVCGKCCQATTSIKLKLEDG